MHPDEFIFEKIIGLMRKLSKFPTVREIVLERSIDNNFPSRGAFRRLGRTNERLATKIIEFCEQKEGYGDIIDFCRGALANKENGEKSDYSESDQTIGEVYLFKSGRYPKIGKTNDTVRRGNEIRIQLPEKMELIHSIKTDDPNGIEAYWHRRFDSKRMQGEWFDLRTDDVKAFKRWRKIV